MKTKSSEDSPEEIARRLDFGLKRSLEMKHLPHAPKTKRRKAAKKSALRRKA